MSVTQSSDLVGVQYPVTRVTTVVEVPQGCRFGAMNVHAESWEAYDALTEEGGWTERHISDPDSLAWKTLGRWPGEYIAAHAPSEPRPVIPCSGCNGEGGSVEYTSGSKQPDPQTEVVCDRCEGSGREIPERAR